MTSRPRLKRKDPLRLNRGIEQTTLPAVARGGSTLGVEVLVLLRKRLSGCTVKRRKRSPRRLKTTLEVRMRRVTGIGGVFFQAKDPKSLCAWYKEHLGIDVQDWVELPSNGLTPKATRSRELRPG